MILERKLFIFLLMFFLTSCAVGPDYKPPVIDAPEKFVKQDVLKKLNKQNEDKQDHRDIPVNWWEGFSDPVLSGLVNKGIENNYSIASSFARLKQAKSFLKLADAQDSLSAIASLDLDASEEFEISSGDTNFNDGIFTSLGLALPIDVFGRVKRQEQSALAQIERSQAELRGTLLQVSTDIASQYLRLRGNQRQLLLLEESVELQEKTLSIVRSRFEAGLSPELDMRRAEASVENLRADIPALKESLVNSRNTIATLTGEYPGEYEELLSNVEEIPEYKGFIPELIPADVLLLRPDVQQAEAELKQTVAEIGVAEAEFYPFFQLVGQIGIGSGGISGASMMDLLVGSIGALVEQFVTDGGARRANLDIAKAGADEAIASYRQTLLDAMNDVERTLAALESSFDRQQSLEKAVAASERSFYQAEILYTQGLTSFLDVVDAQRVLASAQQELASARTEYAFQVASLFRVLGTEIKLGK